MKHIEVVSGIIIYNNLYLCMQRNESKYDYISYKYEFPGGKVEKGELLEDALKRELKEELELVIDSFTYYTTINHTYPDFSITMHAYIVNVVSKNFVMKEHINYKWESVENLDTLDWAKADIPIVRKLKESYYD